MPDKVWRQMVARMQRRLRRRFGDGPVPYDAFEAAWNATMDRYNDRPHPELPRIWDPRTGKQRHLTPNEMHRLVRGRTPATSAEVRRALAALEAGLLPAGCSADAVAAARVIMLATSDAPRA